MKVSALPEVLILVDSQITPTLDHAYLNTLTSRHWLYDTCSMIDSAPTGAVTQNLRRQQIVMAPAF